MSQQRLFVKTSRGVEGPFSPQQIREFAANGTLRPDAHVSEDRKRWIVAAKLKELQFRHKVQSAGAAAFSDDEIISVLEQRDSKRADSVEKEPSRTGTPASGSRGEWYYKEGASEFGPVAFSELQSAA